MAGAASPVASIHWKKPTARMQFVAGGQTDNCYVPKQELCRVGRALSHGSSSAGCLQPGHPCFLVRVCCSSLVSRQRKQVGCSLRLALVAAATSSLGSTTNRCPVPPIPLQWAVNEAESCLWRVLSFSHHETQCRVRYTYPFLFYCWKKEIS